MPDLLKVLSIALCLIFAGKRVSDPTAALTYITHVTVIDTETGAQTPDQSVIISGENILAVGDTRSEPLLLPWV